MTVAEEISVPALASPTIPARTGLTKVHPGLTVMTSESLLAAALQKGKITNYNFLPNNRTLMHAGYLPEKSLTVECNHLITVDSVNTGSSIEAGAGSAVIVVGLAEPATESTWTGASERVDIVLAGGSILARVLCTLIHILLTVLATEAVNAETLKNIKIIDCNKVEYFKFRFMY